jgi:hypothetical protein
VAGALQAAGHATRILDANCDWDVIERETAAYAPDAVGVSLRNIDDVDIVKQHSFVPDLVEVVRRVRAAADARARRHCARSSPVSKPVRRWRPLPGSCVGRTAS